MFLLVVALNCKKTFSEGHHMTFFLKFSTAFYLSTLFLVSCQVDNKKTVGADSFSRIAPACAIVADIITVHNLFDVLASSSGHRLHFLIYDKYLRSLEKYAPLLED